MKITVESADRHEAIREADQIADLQLAHPECTFMSWHSRRRHSMTDLHSTQVSASVTVWALTAHYEEGDLQ